MTEHAPNTALRYDAGKPRFDLIPPEALEALAAHYAAGARKYQDRNWEKGMLWCRCFGSLMRHAWAWLRGEDIDAETGSHHVIAVAWNAFALYAYSVRSIGEDDRPHCGKPAEPLSDQAPICGRVVTAKPPVQR
jgi:hypothetical protein